MSTSILDRALYTIPEAARQLHIPPSTLRWWLEGREHYAPVLRTEPTGSQEVTWGELVEARFLRAYRESGVLLQHLRPVIAKLRDELGVPYPLAHVQPYIGEGRRLVAEAQRVSQLPSELAIIHELESGQLVLGPPADEFWKEVDFGENDGAWAQRLHPAGRLSPVVIDPHRGFGAATVRGIRTSELAELVEAGESQEAVAEDFSVSVAELRAALAYEWQPVAA